MSEVWSVVYKRTTYNYVVLRPNYGSTYELRVTTYELRITTYELRSQYGVEYQICPYPIFEHVEKNCANYGQTVDSNYQYVRRNYVLLRINTYYYV
jgi:hypothetical protein